MAKTQILTYTGLQELVNQIKAGDTAAITAAKNYVGSIEGKKDKDGNAYATVLAYIEDEIAKAAEAGDASNVSITDADEHYTATTVEGALAEIAVSVETLNGADTETGSVAKAIKDKVANLKNEDAAVAHQFVTQAVEADGIVTVSRAALVADDIPDLTLAKITDAGTVASEDVNTGALADADSETATLNENIPTAAQVVKYVKDKTAAVTGALHYRGIKTATSEVTDPAEGDVVIVGTVEYIYDGSAWQELGNEGAWVAKTTTIAGVDLQDNITAAELKTALDIDDLEDVIGDESEGLVKDVDDLMDTVGDSTAGLVKDVTDLQGLVGEGFEAIPATGENSVAVLFA